MPRPKMPKDEIAAALNVKRWVWMEGQRLYLRKDGKFIPSGWSGKYWTSWDYLGKKIDFLILDKDL